MLYFKKIYYTFSWAIAFICFSTTAIIGQQRGDNLSFQGLNDVNAIGVKAAAMGGADVANTGELSSIFSNPAGLADISTIKFSFSGNKFEKEWWENQDYRPNRQFTNLSFILDGLYTPDPANNGKLDFDAFLEDPNYSVDDPTLGLDPYSERAAIWKEAQSDFVLNNVALAVPFKISDIQFVLSGAYSQQNNILDYDRNTTYLDPHIGSNGYGDIVERVTSAEDSVRVNWYDYERSKFGDIKQMTAALSSQLTDYLNLGFGVNIIDGESDDFYSLDKVGYFDLLETANNFIFSYDTLNSSIGGTSKYSGMNFSIGTTIKLDRITLGVRVNTPYTIKREWDYQSNIVGNDTSMISNLKGTDEVELPFTYAIGIEFNPIDDFRVAFDLEKANYSKAEFNLANPDSTLDSWVDQTIIRFGAEYKVHEIFSIMAGYRNKTALFIPDGAAVKDQGPNIKTFTMGLSLQMDIIRLDMAYELRNMTYYDSYFSNTNYNTQKYSNILLGLTIDL